MISCKRENKEANLQQQVALGESHLQSGNHKKHVREKVRKLYFLADGLDILC